MSAPPAALDQAASPGAQPAGVMAAIARPALIGAVVIGLFLALLVGWGSSAPIAGGAIAPGRISPEGSRRTVQHLEGGIIDAILVNDGDQVEVGERLILLRETQARAGFEVLRGQMTRLEAERARLRAEQAGLEEPVFSEDLLRESRTEPEVSELLQTQRDLFRQRFELHLNRVEVLRQRTGQLDAEIAGLREQIVNQNQRLGLIGEEIADTQSLFDRGLAPRPRLLALQREQAAIREQRAANSAAIARAEQSIGETETQMLALEAQRLDEISSAMTEVQAGLAEVGERLVASEDVLNRTSIVAPIAGTVVNKRYSTEGGVIGPGQPILDIVPLDEALIISARLSPTDIDVVEPGMRAAVNLSALPQKNLPRIEGEVIRVSADALVDETTGQSYFDVRVRVPHDELQRLSERLGEDLSLTPGMPADVLIVTGERTVLEYLISPLRDSLRNALREG